jgi:regulator of protease activity HflC (stomatin/prohibitin superfamily)
VVLNAEAGKQSVVLNAEAERTATILKAEADRESALLRAQGEAQAIAMVVAAIKSAGVDDTVTGQEGRMIEEGMRSGIELLGEGSKYEGGWREMKRRREIRRDESDDEG